MNNEYTCPKCSSENTYQDASLWICPDCFHEWDPAESARSAQEELLSNGVFDSNKNMLSDGDTITIIKDLKVKGSSSGIKAGTKVKGIRLVESNDGHNISCKIDGIGAMYLKSEFVRKAQ
jgi:protein PhnA